MTDDRTKIFLAVDLGSLSIGHEQPITNKGRLITNNGRLFQARKKLILIKLVIGFIIEMCIIIIELTNQKRNKLYDLRNCK
jgi:hypothetical protein